MLNLITGTLNAEMVLAHVENLQLVVVMNGINVEENSGLVKIAAKKELNVNILINGIHNVYLKPQFQNPDVEKNGTNVEVKIGEVVTVV